MATIDSVINLCGVGGVGGGVGLGGGTDFSEIFHDFSQIFHTFSNIFHRFFTDSKPHAGTGTDFSHMPSTKQTHLDHRNNSDIDPSDYPNSRL